MQVQVTIPAAEPVIIQGTAKDGRPYKLVKQAALFRLPNGNVEGGSVLAPRVNGEHKPYAPGTYALAPESVSVRDGELAFTPRLVPVSGGAK